MTHNYSTIVFVFSQLIFTFFSYGYADQDFAGWWTLDRADNGIVIESISQSADTVRGFQKHVTGVRGEALLYDGYTTYISRPADKWRGLSGAFSVEAWIAFQAYPWNWVAIVDQKQDSTAGFYLGVSANGLLRWEVAVDGRLNTLTSKEKIDLLKWTHIEGTFDPQKGLAIYINGRPAGTLTTSGKFTAAPNTSLLIGRSHQKLAPAYPIRLDLPASYSFDGLIDEVKIHNKVVPAAQIRADYQLLKPAEEKALSYRKLPTGSEGPGRFGAYYTKLAFSETWDAPWRVGPYADVVVRFDMAPYKFVFWRGTSYIPFWVTENGIWYTNEFNETWGEDVMGCAEPMSDKKARQSNVRIIESNDARVVVHWRYALVDNREIIAKIDTISGWGDWSDEYYTIYPDGVGLRKINLWSSEPAKPHQFQEAIILNPPGTRPEDNIEVKAITMVNMRGESQTYSWADGAPEVIDKPDHFNIQLINLKSKNRPFIIVSEAKPGVTRWNIETDGPWIRPYSGEINRQYSIFPWWNHWPVAQIPSDGRWATEPDRVSHSSLSNDLEWKELELTDRTHVRVMMHGLTNRSAQEVVMLAKSWLYPAPLILKCESYRFDGYKEEERAYVLKNTGTETAAFRCQLDASSDYPLENPAFVINDWGDGQARLLLNGEEIDRGKQFRYGHRHRLEGSDLIVWINEKSSVPLDISIEPAD